MPEKNVDDEENPDDLESLLDHAGQVRAHEALLAHLGHHLGGGSLSRCLAVQVLRSERSCEK